MTAHKSKTLQGSDISRRDFIAGAGGLTFTIVLTGCEPEGDPDVKAAIPEPVNITVWVRINQDNRVTILNPAAEMGQGSMTALPLIVAEEMDADWEQVDIEYAPPDAEAYGIVLGKRPGKIMITVGSRSVMDYFTRLRQAGAQVRQVLLGNAARKWKVPVGELTTEPGVVVHAASGRRATYGAIATFAEIPEQIPEVPEADLKPASEFRFIGKSMPRVDVPMKVDGSAEYSIDVQLAGMFYAMVVHAPVHGKQVEEFNGDAIATLPGIVDVVPLRARTGPPGNGPPRGLSPFVAGVGVIGRTVEAVMRARDQLAVRWSEDAPAEKFDSEEALAGYADLLAEQNAELEVVHQRGDADASLAEAVKTYQADYRNDHVYHAQTEPLNAVASYHETDGSIEVWAGTQSPTNLVLDVTAALGIAPSKVKLHRCFLGGGFGRRSNSDNVVQAALLSRAVGHPVKLLWSREDDMISGQFRPMALQHLEAGVNVDGKIIGWKHCVVGDGSSGPLDFLAEAIETPFYDLPNQHLDRRPLDHGVKLKHWRSVAHGINKYAIEAFVDEIAADQGIDPYEFRKRLMENSPRARKVVDAVAEISGWESPRSNGRALGMAFAERSKSLAAGVAEVSLDRNTGKIRVHRFWAAVDAGLIVQPENAVAQVESGIVFGLSSVLHERVTFKRGEVQQSNFHDYRVMRFGDAPEAIMVELVPSDHPPTGIGESGVPITAAAVANAVFALTGIMLRHMPFTPDRVLAAFE